MGAPAHRAPLKGADIEPKRISRAEHSVSRADISPGTLKVLYTLRDAGYQAYMVGGGVRDLLAGIKPKDFDVATDAHPEQIRKLFRSCRLVGRRFLIAHVRVGPEIVEVTTFRGAIGESHDRDDTGRILSDNVYGTLEEDAFRRDFTINGLYYDIRDYAIVDYVGGLEDLKMRRLRLIGDPELRYREDPVRMLRAVRIANKMHFQLDPTAAEPVKALAPLLREIPPARLFDEVLKLLFNRDAVENFRALHWFGLWKQLFPDADAALERDPSLRTFLEWALQNTADRLEQLQSVSPSFLFAALLWPAVEARARQLMTQQAHPFHIAVAQAADEHIARQNLRVAVPKRFSLPAREIWLLQPRFEARSRYKRFLAHPRFRAAYDFLVLRARSGDGSAELAQWWTEVQAGEPPTVPEASAAEAEEAPSPSPARRRRRRRRGGRRPDEAGPAPT